MIIKFMKIHRSTKLKQEKNTPNPITPSVLFFSCFPNFHLHLQTQPRYSSIQITQAHNRCKRQKQNYLLPLPRVYPSHHFENMPPLAACSFQLARRVAISAFVDSRFCVFRFEKRPPEEPAELRRRSARLGGFGVVPSVCLFPSEEVEVLESFILVLDWVWRCGMDR